MKVQTAPPIGQKASSKAITLASPSSAPRAFSTILSQLLAPGQATPPVPPFARSARRPWPRVTGKLAMGIKLFGSYALGGAETKATQSALLPGVPDV